MPDAPRIVFLAGDFEPDRDGVADYTRRLAAALDGHGWEPLVAAAARPQGAPADVPIAPIIEGWSPGAVVRLGARLRRLGAAIVHVQAAPTTFGRRGVLRWLPLALRPGGWRGPVVVTLHEHTPPTAATPRLLRAAFDRGLWDPDLGILLPLADAIVVTSERERASLAVSHALAPRVRLIPLPPNLEPLPEPAPAVRAALRHGLGFPPDAAVVAFFGFVHPVKRLPDLLVAVAQVRSRHPRLRLLVVGGWDPLSLTPAEASAQRAGVEALIEQLGLGDAVRFTGHVSGDRASALLSIADLAAVSMAYGVGPKSGSLIALLAHGLPTIAPLPPDGVPDMGRKAGIVSVPPRDPTALAGAIERLLDDPVLRRRLAAAARRFGRNRSWAATAAAHETLYASLVGPGRVSRATEDTGVRRAAR